MSPSGQSDRGPEPSGLVQALGDVLLCGVILVNREGIVASFSDETATALRWDSAQARPRTTADLPGPLQEVAELALASNQPTGLRLLRLATSIPGGGVLAVRAFPAGTNQGAILVLNDLTAASRLEHQVLQLDRLANVGTLAASMAHEIKNALVAGKTFMDLLLEKHQDDELVQIVRREMGRIDGIVGRMLRFTGTSRPGFASMSLHEVLEHSLKLVQPKLDEGCISLVKTFAASPDLVMGNDRELQQAFVNLLLNALEAMPAQGTLTVATCLVSPPETATGSTAPRQLRLSIRDTGPGIAPEHLPRLFEAFFTTKPNGTGLGLAITQRIVQEHHGVIQAESSHGQGAVFHILLPAVETPPS